MESVGKEALLDADGRPLDPRIQTVLRELVPRFRNRFLTVRDELLVTEIFEEAGRRIVEYEAASGPADNLGAYAWRILRNVAVSRLRHSSTRLERAMLGSEASALVLGSLRSHHGTPAQIEASVLLEEYLAPLTAQEREFCMWKKFGYTSREIAGKLGTTEGYVDNLFYRIKRKCQEARDNARAAADSSTPTTSHAMRARPDVIASE